MSTITVTISLLEANQRRYLLIDAGDVILEITVRRKPGKDDDERLVELVAALEDFIEQNR